MASPLNLGSIAPDAFWHKPTVIRPANDDAGPAGPIEVSVVSNDEDAYTSDGGALHIPTEDGGVIVDFSGHPDDDGSDDLDSDTNFGANLAGDIDAMILSTIAEDLLEGIDIDISSRSEWLDTRTRALDLLGIKLDPPKSNPGGGTSGAPLEGMATVRDPALVEAVVRGQANAIGEFLPADGPAQIEDMGDNPEDELAEILQKDFNDWLMNIATEYYPDTKQMFAWVYFGGSTVKKVYRCPLRRRPVSETVEMQNFVVSNAATDLKNAERATHIIEMRKSAYRRMVAAGEYLDIDGLPPTARDKDPVTAKTEKIEGVRADTTRLEDQPYTFYEVLCELDIEIDSRVPAHLKKNKVPVPYKVTIEKDSRRIVDLRRWWKEDDEEAMQRRLYVKYSFVDWIGFYGLGLMHLMGNLTMALTAMLRISIDNGMFANFPGGLVAKNMTGQIQNDFTVGPGQFAPVDTSMIPDGDIRKVVMKPPYTDITPGFLQLMSAVRDATKAVGGTADMPVAEGRADVPVGTILALIEQGSKVESAVHKGLHQSTTEEFQMLLELFREDPESFWRHRKLKRGQQNPWDEQKLLQALENYNLVPKSDPNTPSHLHRIMRAVALVQMAEGATTKGMAGLFDMKAVYKQALQVLRYPNPDQYFAPPPAPQAQQPDPKLIEAQAKDKTADAKKLETQVKAQTADTDSKAKVLGYVSSEKVAEINLKKEGLIHGADMAKATAEHGLKSHGQAHDQRMDVAGHALDVAKATHEAQIDAHEATKPEPKPTGGAK